jgi:hypothetical protein
MIKHSFRLGKIFVLSGAALYLGLCLALVSAVANTPRGQGLNTRLKKHFNRPRS